MTTRRNSQRLRAARRRRQGFTLVELMVALVAGAIALVSIYFVGAASSRHFQEQQRIAQQQMALRMAMEQIRRDFSLVSFHGTPNSQNEIRCTTPPTNIVGVEHLEDDATANLPNAPLNDVHADTVRLTGNYVTTDGYLAIGLDGGGTTVHLQRNWQAFRRTFGADDPGGFSSGYSPEMFEDVFRQGRWMHLETQQQRHFFGEIQSSNGTAATITFTPGIQPGGHCTVGLADSAMVAPITRVEYTVVDANTEAELESLRVTDPAFRAVEGDIHPVLIRREIEVDSDTPIPGTTRVIAEYVADFDVDYWVDTAADDTSPPNLELRDDDAIAGVDPHRIRSAVVRLSVRTSREDTRFPFTTRDPALPLTRYEVLPDAVGAARVRTATEEIAMPNLIYPMMR